MRGSQMLIGFAPNTAAQMQNNGVPMKLERQFAY